MSARRKRFPPAPVFTDTDPETREWLRGVAIEATERLNPLDRTALNALFRVAMRFYMRDPRLPEPNRRLIDVMLWERMYDKPYDDAVGADLIIYDKHFAGEALFKAWDCLYSLRTFTKQEPLFSVVRSMAQEALVEFDGEI